MITGPHWYMYLRTLLNLLICMYMYGFCHCAYINLDLFTHSIDLRYNIIVFVFRKELYFIHRFWCHIITKSIFLSFKLLLL